LQEVSTHRSALETMESHIQKELAKQLQEVQDNMQQICSHRDTVSSLGTRIQEQLDQHCSGVQENISSVQCRHISQVSDAVSSAASELKELSQCELQEVSTHRSAVEAMESHVHEELAKQLQEVQDSVQQLCLHRDTVSSLGAQIQSQLDQQLDGIRENIDCLQSEHIGQVSTAVSSAAGQLKELSRCELQEINVSMEQREHELRVATESCEEQLKSRASSELAQCASHLGVTSTAHKDLVEEITSNMEKACKTNEELQQRNIELAYSDFAAFLDKSLAEARMHLTGESQTLAANAVADAEALRREVANQVSKVVDASRAHIQEQLKVHAEDSRHFLDVHKLQLSEEYAASQMREESILDNVLTRLNSAVTFAHQEVSEQLSLQVHKMVQQAESWHHQCEGEAAAELAKTADQVGLHIEHEFTALAQSINKTTDERQKTLAQEHASAIRQLQEHAEEVHTSAERVLSQGASELAVAVADARAQIHRENKVLMTAMARSVMLQDSAGRDELAPPQCNKDTDDSFTELAGALSEMSSQMEQEIKEMSHNTGTPTSNKTWSGGLRKLFPLTPKVDVSKTSTGQPSSPSQVLCQLQSAGMKALQRLNEEAQALAEASERSARLTEKTLTERITGTIRTELDQARLDLKSECCRAQQEIAGEAAAAGRAACEARNDNAILPQSLRQQIVKEVQGLVHADMCKELARSSGVTGAVGAVAAQAHQDLHAVRTEVASHATQERQAFDAAKVALSALRSEMQADLAAEVETNVVAVREASRRASAELQTKMDELKRLQQEITMAMVRGDSQEVTSTIPGPSAATVQREMRSELVEAACTLRGVGAEICASQARMESEVHDEVSQCREELAASNRDLESKIQLLCQKVHSEAGAPTREGGGLSQTLAAELSQTLRKQWRADMASAIQGSRTSARAEARDLHAETRRHADGALTRAESLVSELRVDMGAWASELRAKSQDGAHISGGRTPAFGRTRQGLALDPVPSFGAPPAPRRPASSSPTPPVARRGTTEPMALSPVRLGRVAVEQASVPPH